MKRLGIAAAMASACILTAALWIHGQTTVAGPSEGIKPERRTIDASGSATIRVKPDSARVFFGVQTIAKTVKAAREENSARTKAVLDALKNLHIKDLKMKTSNVNVELIQSHRGEAFLPEILGYRLTNSFTVLAVDNDAVSLAAHASQVLDTALESGANMVQQVVFFRQDEDEARHQAYTKAVEAALANARALADGAKVAIKETVSVSGQPEFNQMYNPAMQNSMPVGGLGGSETPVVAGDLEISCRVSITCRY